MGRVLVTGGAGFVGSYVVEGLVREGHDVVIYDVVLEGNVWDTLSAAGVLGQGPGFESRLTYLQGSVADPWRLYRVCEEYDVDRIVHLASPLTEDVTKDPVRGLGEICGGFCTVLEVARAFAIQRIVWASSAAVFDVGGRRNNGAINGGPVSWAPTLYGCCKQLCEVMAQRYWEVDGVDSLGVRLAVVYGCGRLRGFMTQASDLIREVAIGRPVRVQYSHQRINWQYVEDAACLIRRCLDPDVACGGGSFSTSGDVRTYGEAASVLRELAPHVPITLSDGLDPALEETEMMADMSAFHELSGFVPKFTMEAGITATYEKFRDLLAAHPNGVVVRKL